MLNSAPEKLRLMIAALQDAHRFIQLPCGTPIFGYDHVFCSWPDLHLLAVSTGALRAHLESTIAYVVE